MGNDDLSTLEQNVEATGNLPIDVSLSAELPGYVRVISLRRGCKLAVEFDKYGHEEGGLYFIGEYASFKHAVAALEAFVNRPASAWVNCDQEYPPPPTTQLAGRESHDMVVAALQAGGIRLPGGATFRLGSAYWAPHWQPDQS